MLSDHRHCCLSFRPLLGRPVVIFESIARCRCHLSAEVQPSVVRRCAALPSPFGCLTNARPFQSRFFPTVVWPSNRHLYRFRSSFGHSGRHSLSSSGRCRYSNRHRSENCSDRIPATPRLLSGSFGRSPAIFVAVSDLPSDFRPSVCFRLCRPCLTAAASAGLVQPSRSTVVSLSDTV